MNKLVVFLAMLSAYTDKSQFNILLNAPSSSGKTYIPIEIAKYFPPESIARNTTSLFILSCLIVSQSIRMISSHLSGGNLDTSIPRIISLYFDMISSITPPFPIHSDISFPISLGSETLYISFSGKRTERRLISFSAHFSQASSISKHI